MKKLILHLVLLSACNLAPGSYPNAEVYELRVSEDELVKVITSVKRENPEIDLTELVRIPKGGIAELKDGRVDHWYNFYFYYQDKNQIIKTWTRSASKGTTNIAFVGVNDGLTLGNWSDPNKESTKEFEQRILSKIKEKIK